MLVQMAVYRPNNDQIPPPDCLVQAGYTASESDYWPWSP